ncbi:MAG: Gfo/Idh/MocA family protein [Gallintestinimicrobium sp.]
MKKVMVGIIGCGTIANSAHIPAYLKNEDVEIKYFCDIIPERAKAAVEKYGCGIAVEDYHKVLEDPEVEAISVCTPNRMHAIIAIDAMRAESMCSVKACGKNLSGSVGNAESTA